MTGMVRPAGRAVVVLMGLTALVAACGGGSSGPASQTSTTMPGGRTTASPTPDPGSEARIAEALSAEWPVTDFSKATVPLSELLRGCPAGRECIPALDADGATADRSSRVGDATFVSVARADTPDDFPVAFVTVNGETRAYPLHVLIWHEIVNDVVGGVPVAVTYCPLCNIAVAFEREVAGRRLDFSVTGFLRNSDLVMFDRQTESWWQQATGEAIAGSFAGERLEVLTTRVVSFGEFAAAFPDAEVLTESTGFGMQYGVNPYRDYEYGNQFQAAVPFLFQGEYDPRLPPLARVLTLGADTGDPLALRYSTLHERGVATVEVGGTRVVAFTSGGTRSVLDQSEISESAYVGTAVAYRAAIDGRELTFAAADDRGFYRDEETGSRWDITGLAIEGPLKGKALEPVLHTTEFWFAWAAFQPETRLWDGK